MDLKGRAKVSSVKNMVLVDADDETKDVLILGKAGDHTFNVEINYPLSPRVAMGILNSCFDFKWISQ